MILLLNSQIVHEQLDIAATDIGFELIGQLSSHITRKAIRQGFEMIDINDCMPRHLNEIATIETILKTSQRFCRCVNALGTVNHQCCLINIGQDNILCLEHDQLIIRLNRQDTTWSSLEVFQII